MGPRNGHDAGGEPRQVVEPGSEPAWSPRGDGIVFEHATVTANIWTARLTGGRAARTQ